MIILKKAVMLMLRAAYLFVLFGILLFSAISVIGTVSGVLSMNFSGMAAAIVPNIIMLLINALTAWIARRIDRFTFLTHMVITIVHGVICFSSFIVTVVNLLVG